MLLNHIIKSNMKLIREHTEINKESYIIKFIVQKS